MEKYDVSIIVPVYNRENLIKLCIESINSQTYDKSKWEVIFVDDASKDKTIETIETLIDKHINYRILKRPVGSGNASAPRNEGIKASLGKYVFFLDSDDYVDSQLLENGMAMALKNDSDMVYVKVKAIGRHMTAKPFMKGNIGDADILKDHIVRTLAPFKFVKKELLIENHILFIPSIVKAEDQIFFIQTLSKCKKVSILANKEYYIQQAHEEGHLSNAKLSMESFIETIIIPLNSIYMSQISKENQKMLFNAWLLRSVERIRDFTRKISIENEQFINMFQLASSYFNIHKELFDLSQIYENEKLLTLLFLSGDFENFHKLANESKVLKQLQETLEKEFKYESSFSKAWIFGNKVAVLDFSFKENKIAFDLEVDEKKNLLKVWMFSRNNLDLPEILRKKAIKIEKNKLLILDGKFEEKEAIKKIKDYFKEVENG